LEQAWLKADEIDQTYPANVAATWAGNRLVHLLDPVAAISQASREIDKRREVEAPNRRQTLLQLLADANACSGNLAECKAILGSANASADVAMLLGNWDAAETAWTRIRDFGARRHNLTNWSIASIGLARLRWLRADPSALDLLQDVFSHALEGPSVVLQMRSGTESAIRLAQRGRVDEAEAALGHCREIVDKGEDWRGLAGRFELAEAAVAYAGRRPDEAAPNFERALEIFRRYSLPWDEADAYHLRGRLLARMGRYRGLAAESFEAALAVYHRIGAAEPWIASVLESQKRELGRYKPGLTRHPDDLTARETEVLVLIAAGKSNREIAEDLVLSVRTVERHITNIYGKIGARGKADATAYAMRNGLV
jgi:DNA-binding CsgD family transcriptional regulator